MTENELATIAVDICFKIHSYFGPGLLESVYEAAFAHELNKRKIPFTRQQIFPVHYGGITIDMGFRTDIVMDKKLIVEIKSISQLEKVHHKIVLTYLKLTGIKLGILVNFNANLIKEGIHRKIMGELAG